MTTLSKETNGNGKWQQWMLNTILTLCLAIGGWLYQTHTTIEQQRQQEDQAWHSMVAAEQARQNERIAVLENENKNFRELLEKVDQKTDQILDRLRR